MFPIQAKRRPIRKTTLNARLSLSNSTPNDLLELKRVPLSRYMTQIKDKFANPTQKLHGKKYSYSELLSLHNDSTLKPLPKLPPLTLSSKAACMHSKSKPLPTVLSSPSPETLRKVSPQTHSLAALPKPPTKLLVGSRALKLSKVEKPDGPITKWSDRSPCAEGGSGWPVQH